MLYVKLLIFVPTGTFFFARKKISDLAEVENPLFNTKEKQLSQFFFFFVRIAWKFVKKKLKKPLTFSILYVKIILPQIN